MPIRPKRGSTALTAERADLERTAALEESGRDPFAEGLQALIPVNRATGVAQQEGRVAGLAELAKSMLMGRGTVTTPRQSDYLKLQQTDPKVAAALQRAPTSHGFASIPEEVFNAEGVLPGITGVPAAGLAESGHPILGALSRVSGDVVQGINPWVDRSRSLRDLARRTRLHEGLHALRYGKQIEQGALEGKVPLTGNIDPRFAERIVAARKSQGYEPSAATATDAPHAAIDAMAWNIMRKNPRK